METYCKTTRDNGRFAIFKNLEEKIDECDQICVFSKNPVFNVGDYYLSSYSDEKLEPRDYLLLFPAPYGKMAYNLFDQEYFDKNWRGNEFTKEEVLVRGFDWVKTPQKGDFWYQVCYGQSPEISQQTEKQIMKENIQTEVTPAFAAFIQSHPKAKIKSEYSARTLVAVLYLKEKSNSINFLSSDNYGHKKVTQGEFIDALNFLPDEPKEVTLDFQVVGHYPIIGENVKIGCQTFELEDLKKFAAEYKTWTEQQGGFNCEDFYTESSTELRQFVYSLRPDLCCYREEDFSSSYRCLSFSSWSNEPIGGNPLSFHGEKLTVGQFIDKVANLKKERPPTKIQLGGIEVSVSEKGGMTVYGLISHETIEKLINKGINPPMTPEI